VIESCIPTRATKPPIGPQWIHEIKHDGYRLIACKRGDRVRLFTRNGFDWTDRYPRISAAVAALRTASATIDGEAVWCDGAGLAVFDKLHSRAHDGEVSLYAFDLLELDGTDWRPRTLEERKAKLQELLAAPGQGSNIASTSRATARPSSLTPAGSARRVSSRSIASTRAGRGRVRLGSKPRTQRRRGCCGSGRSHERRA
jgi:ATP-dependent DNA ligase